MKVAVISDIHVNDYSLYNPTPNFRLGQYLKLADYLGDIKDDEDLEEVWICGDLLVTPLSSPKVMNCLREFLSSLIEKGYVVRSILGNHDLTVKNKSTSVEKYFENTLVSLMSGYDYFHLYGSCVVDVGGHSVFFQSWRPENDIDYKDAEYMVCHGDIDSELSPFAGVLINYTRYKRTLAGHTHVAKDTDRYNSIGTPFMHNYNDSRYTSILVFDLDSNSVKRIDTSKMFLVLLYAENNLESNRILSDYKSLGQDCYVRIKNKVSLVDSDDSAKVQIELNPRKVIDRYINSYFTSDDMKSKVREIMTTSGIQNSIAIPDLRVDFLSLKASNFLSITDMSLDLTKFNGLTVIVGENGSGKSTLFNLMVYCLHGRIKGYNKDDYKSKFGDGEMVCRMTLRYNGHEYEIVRGTNVFKLFKDSVPLDANKKSDLQAVLESELKFMEFYPLMFVSQDSRGVFYEMTEGNRISFISNLIGINLVDEFSRNLTDYHEEMKLEVVKMKDSIREIKSRIEVNSKVINDSLDDEKVISDGDISEKLSSVESKIMSDLKVREEMMVQKSKLENDLQDSASKIKSKDSMERQLSDLLHEKTKLESDISKTEEMIRIMKSEIGEELDPDFVNDEIERISNEISDINSKISVKESLLESVLSSISELKSHPNVCPVCNQRWDTSNLLEEKESKRSDLNIKIESMKSILGESESRLSNFKSVLSKINKIEKESNALTLSKSNLSSSEKRISMISDSIESIKIGDVGAIESELTTVNDNVSSMSSTLDELSSKRNKLIGIAERNKLALNVKSRNDELRSENRKLQIEVSEKSDRVSIAESNYTSLGKFISEVLGDGGLLVSSLLKSVTDFLNKDDKIIIETVRVAKNGSQKPCLNLKLYVDEYGDYIDYKFLSGGQRLQADLRFLNELSSGLGSISFLFLDELFKYFSDNFILESSNILKDMNVRNVFLIIHSSTLQESISNNVIHVRLDRNTGSVYE